MFQILRLHYFFIYLFPLRVKRLISISSRMWPWFTTPNCPSTRLALELSSSLSFLSLDIDWTMPECWSFLLFSWCSCCCCWCRGCWPWSRVFTRWDPEACGCTWTQGQWNIYLDGFYHPQFHFYLITCYANIIMNIDDMLII